jgi:Ca-activated chloride channel family protein
MESRRIILTLACAGVLALVATDVGRAFRPGGPEGPPYVLQRQPTPQDPTFRGGTRTVPIWVSATDDIGRFVLDLKREDFEIRDDGKLQTITQFTTDVQAMTAVVLLDGSRSMVKALDTVITAADHLVVRLRPGDRARVGSFADEIRFTPAFTSDRDLLARQVNDLFDLRIGATTRLWDAVAQATRQFEGGEGRRVIVVFTDGDDTASIASADEALTRARRADAMLYMVLIRGMERLPEDRRGARRGGRSQDSADVALSTGGGYYVVNNVLDDMNMISTQIAEELHNQYVLGFVPADLDGKLHKLDVRVKRPRLKVRARQTYIAEPEQIGGR